MAPNKNIRIQIYPLPLFVTFHHCQIHANLSFETKLVLGENTVKNTDMFGRVRASPSPSSLDSFDTPPSKIIKDDSLSIYETTLMKLKLGSQRHTIPPPTMTDLTDSYSGTTPTACQEMHFDDESMVIDTDSSSASASVADCSSDRHSTGDLNSQQRSIPNLNLIKALQQLVMKQ